MTNNHDQERLKHRQKALGQLREQLGSPRQESSNAGIDSLNQAREVLKIFSQEEKLRRSQNLPAAGLGEETDGEDEANDLPIETPVTDTIKQLHQQKKAKQTLKQQLAEKSNLDIDSSFSPVVQQQLVRQLLSSDFLKNTQLWLSSTTESEKEMASTSLEELGECQKQVKYRLRVLQVLQQETQRELDHLELQIRMAQNSSNNSGE
jgi:hypothetical protein